VSEPLPFYVVGPTGSGKSSIALSLAERWGGEIVNADAFQVYRGIPIITAAPSAEDLERVPHHLYEVIPLDEDYNVARYAREAEEIIQDIQSRGRRPIIVGGSGLYIKALTHGLADTPPGDPEFRETLETLTEEARVAWLERLDPEGAAAMNLLNPRYVMRALEITLLTGVPASVLKAEWQRNEPMDIEGISISWEREDLYTRINDRVGAMLELGALEEIAVLSDTISNTALKAIGVRELQGHLAGEWSLEEAMAAIQRSSRRYAKRQMNWFRRETVFQRMTWAEAMAF
jgi:tRNA dimethylallyltransferase